jgi:cardiolipin synthase
VSDVPTRVPAAGSWRVLTIPNVLSIARLCCIPIFLWLLFGRENRAAAAGLLGALGATDWVDGYVARHFGQVTELGKILDPVADRLLLLVGIVAITADGSVPLWFALAAITRELLVAAAALVLAALGARRIDVTWWGKAGTFGLLFAFPFSPGSAASLGSSSGTTP